MTAPIDTASERWRAICEARYWLRQGFNTPEKVKALTQTISQKRGPQAAAELIDEMRAQWRTRSEWLAD